MPEYPLLTSFISLLVTVFAVGITIGVACGLLFHDYLVSRPTLRILNEELHKLQEDNRYLYANQQRHGQIASSTRREKRTQENG